MTTILATFMVFALAEARRNLRVHRDTIFREARAEIRAIAAFHHRSIGQRGRREREQPEVARLKRTQRILPL